MGSSDERVRVMSMVISSDHRRLFKRRLRRRLGEGAEGEDGVRVAGEEARGGGSSRLEDR